MPLLMRQSPARTAPLAEQSARASLIVSALRPSAAREPLPPRAPPMRLRQAARAMHCGDASCVAPRAVWECEPGTCQRRGHPTQHWTRCDLGVTAGSRTCFRKAKWRKPSATGDGHGQKHRFCFHPVLGFISSGHASFTPPNAGQQRRDRTAGMRHRFSARCWPLRAQFLCPPLPPSCAAMCAWIASCQRQMHSLIGGAPKANDCIGNEARSSRHPIVPKFRWRTRDLPRSLWASS